MSAGRNFIDRFLDGAPTQSFKQHEAKALAERLMETEAYRNHRHIDHLAVSREVRQLFQHAAPGRIGPGGEVTS